MGNNAPGHIWHDQGALFGEPRCVGFGNEAFAVKVIDRDVANAIIRRNHYSRKFYSASTVHLGVYISSHLMGILQFGFAMNPASADSVVAGTQLDEYLELNRMWLDDAAPTNSESRALSCAVKFIRRALPKVKWLQSFADERCGRLGVVYQAANFEYFGEHVATFWEIDGTIYHNSLMTRSPDLCPSARFVRDNRSRAIRHDFRQFRYLYFMQPRFRRGVRRASMNYPKPNNATCPVDELVPTSASAAQPREVAPYPAEAMP